MKPVAASVVILLLAAACSKPTELASEANAKYDERDAVVAAPPPDAEIDATPIDPEPGTPEAEASTPAEAGVAPPEVVVDEFAAPVSEPSPEAVPEPLPPVVDPSATGGEPSVSLPDSQAPN